METRKCCAEHVSFIVYASILRTASVVTYPGEYAFRFDGDMVTIEPLLKLSSVPLNRLSTHAGGRWKYTLNRCGTSRGHGRWGPALMVNGSSNTDFSSQQLLLFHRAMAVSETSTKHLR